MRIKWNQNDEAIIEKRHIEIISLVWLIGALKGSSVLWSSLLVPRNSKSLSVSRIEADQRTRATAMLMLLHASVYLANLQLSACLFPISRNTSLTTRGTNIKHLHSIITSALLCVLEAHFNWKLEVENCSDVNGALQRNAATSLASRSTESVFCLLIPQPG